MTIEATRQHNVQTSTTGSFWTTRGKSHSRLFDVCEPHRLISSCSDCVRSRSDWGHSPEAFLEQETRRDLSALKRKPNFTKWMLKSDRWTQKNSTHLFGWVPAARGHSGRERSPTRSTSRCVCVERPSFQRADALPAWQAGWIFQIVVMFSSPQELCVTWRFLHVRCDTLVLRTCSVSCWAFEERKVNSLSGSNLGRHQLHIQCKVAVLSRWRDWFAVSTCKWKI